MSENTNKNVSNNGTNKASRRANAFRPAGTLWLGIAGLVVIQTLLLNTATDADDVGIRSQVER